MKRAFRADLSQIRPTTFTFVSPDLDRGYPTPEAANRKSSACPVQGPTGRGGRMYHSPDAVTLLVLYALHHSLSQYRSCVDRVT